VTPFFVNLFFGMAYQEFGFEAFFKRERAVDDCRFSDFLTLIVFLYTGFGYRFLEMNSQILHAETIDF